MARVRRDFSKTLEDQPQYDECDGKRVLDIGYWVSGIGVRDWIWGFSVSGGWWVVGGGCGCGFDGCRFRISSGCSYKYKYIGTGTVIGTVIGTGIAMYRYVLG
jgi:hypothetical protein